MILNVPFSFLFCFVLFYFVLDFLLLLHCKCIENARYDDIDSLLFNINISCLALEIEGSASVKINPAQCCIKCQVFETFLYKAQIYCLCSWFECKYSTYTIKFRVNWKMGITIARPVYRKMIKVATYDYTITFRNWGRSCWFEYSYIIYIIYLNFLIFRNPVMI